MSGSTSSGMWAIYSTRWRRTRHRMAERGDPGDHHDLYFIVFRGAIGSRMPMGGVDYGAFIVPGLIMLTLLTQGISSASVAIPGYEKFTRTLYDCSAPISSTGPYSPISGWPRQKVGVDPA